MTALAAAAGRWSLSLTMYVAGELVADRVARRPTDPARVARIATVGATGDALLLRGFHGVVDRRLPNPLLRTVAEQLLFAPCADAGYLTLRHGSWSRWSWDEFRDVYVRDLAFWPVVSYCGYRFVPLQRRFLWVTGATLVWNSLRSSAAHD